MNDGKRIINQIWQTSSGSHYWYAWTEIALLTPTTLLLTLKVIEIDPKNAVAAFRLITGIGALIAFIANPIGGAISDRTRFKFGRRRTWIILGCIIGGISTAIIGTANQVWVIGLCWSITCIFYNFAQSSYVALIADQIPESKRGAVSGIIGMLSIVSIVVGMVIMSAIVNAGSPTKWITISVIGGVAAISPAFLAWLIRTFRHIGHPQLHAFFAHDLCFDLNYFGDCSLIPLRPAGRYSHSRPKPGLLDRALLLAPVKFALRANEMLLRNVRYAMRMKCAAAREGKFHIIPPQAVLHIRLWVNISRSVGWNISLTPASQATGVIFGALTLKSGGVRA